MHWEGLTQLHAIFWAQTQQNVLWAQTEAVRFRFKLAKWHEYTCDLEVAYVDGPIEIVELKSDDHGLTKPDYVMKLAAVAEICRVLGWRFAIRTFEEVVTSHHHRHNLLLFASRAFATVLPRHIRRLEGYAVHHGLDAHYGELAMVLEPEWPVGGKAVIQALVVQRRIEIDLRRRLTDWTPLRIH